MNGDSGPRVVHISFGKDPKHVLRILAGAVLGLVVLFLLVTSYYQVEPNETGVVLRFGRFVKAAPPGPHLRIPFGVDRVYKVKTDYQYKEEFGFRTLKAGIRTEYSGADFTSESDMLTGDLNIASVTWVVQYHVKDARAFLFNLRDVPGTIRAVSESAMRSVVGDRSFNEVIHSSRQDIELEVKQIMQQALDLYGCGVSIKLVQLQDVHPPAPVKDSFDEVNRARQEMDQAMNEAEQAYNKVIYRVKGEAKQVIQEARGEKTQRINRAKGDAARFEKLLVEYRRAPEVTRRRLYLEALGRVLKNLDRVYIVDEETKGLIPFLDLAGKGGGK